MADAVSGRCHRDADKEPSDEAEGTAPDQPPGKLAGAFYKEHKNRRAGRPAYADSKE